MYQQVLNLRKGVGHPFVEPQLGVGDDGVLTGNFSQKAGIAISNSSHVPGAPRSPPPLTRNVDSKWRVSLMICNAIKNLKFVFALDVLTLQK